MTATNEILFGAFLGLFILVGSGVIYWIFYHREMGDICPSCNGNDMDKPCAYPSEGKEWCLRDARIKKYAEVKDAKEHCNESGCCCHDVCSSLVDRDTSCREIDRTGSIHR